METGDNTNGSVTLDQWLETAKKIVIGKPISDSPGIYVFYFSSFSFSFLFPFSFIYIITQ
jgi:hypothetical protein